MSFADAFMFWMARELAELGFAALVFLGVVAIFSLIMVFVNKERK